MSLLFLLSLPPAALFRYHQLKDDTEFREFLSVHQKRVQTATWANDALDAEPSKGKSKLANDYLNFDSDSGQESEEEGAGEDLEGEVIHPHVCASCQRRAPACVRACVCVTWGPSVPGGASGPVSWGGDPNRSYGDLD